jgi:hypothetical protein
MRKSKPRWSAVKVCVCLIAAAVLVAISLSKRCSKPVVKWSKQQSRVHSLPSTLPRDPTEHLNESRDGWENSEGFRMGQGGGLL